MIDSFYNFLHWYYITDGTEKGAGMDYFAPFFAWGIGLLALVLSICFAWSSDHFHNFLGDFVAVVFLGLLLFLFIAFAWPFLLIFCFVIGAYFLIFKWGNNYRALAKRDEERKLSALAALIKEDPEVKAAYEKIMKETPKI